MDIMTKAKELGEGIAASDEMAALKKAEAEIGTDAKAKQLLEDYSLLQQELVRATEEKRADDIVEAVKKRLFSKYEELKSYNVTSRYFEAKIDFDNLMKTINNVIIFAITGEEPCSPDKCGSCGGCK